MSVELKMCDKTKETLTEQSSSLLHYSIYVDDINFIVKTTSGNGDLQMERSVMESIRKVDNMHVMIFAKVYHVAFQLGFYACPYFMCSHIFYLIVLFSFFVRCSPATPALCTVFLCCWSVDGWSSSLWSGRAEFTEVMVIKIVVVITNFEGETQFPCLNITDLHFTIAYNLSTFLHSKIYIYRWVYPSTLLTTQPVRSLEWMQVDDLNAYFEHVEDTRNVEILFIRKTISPLLLIFAVGTTNVNPL